VKKNFFRPNLQEKCVCAPPQDTKCTPQPVQESILGVFAGWLRFGGIFRRRRLKKSRQLFLRKKSAPRRQNPGYAYEAAQNLLNYRPMESVVMVFTCPTAPEEEKGKRKEEKEGGRMDTPICLDLAAPMYSFLLYYRHTFIVM